LPSRTKYRISSPTWEALPETWDGLIDDLGQVEPDSRRRQELEARLRVWCLFAELRANQVEAEATLAQATALKKATWVLAIATFILVIATIAAAIIVVAAG